MEPQTDSQVQLPAGNVPRVDIPAWYPLWAKELADLYYSGSVCLFLLHGNVHDLIAAGPAGAAAICQSYASFSRTSCSAPGTRSFPTTWDAGCRWRPAATRDGGRRWWSGPARCWATSTPGRASRRRSCSRSSMWCQRNLLQDRPGQQKRMAFLFRVRAVPGPLGRCAGMLARGEASRLVRLICLGPEPVHQTRQHGLLPDRRQADRAERSTGAESARGRDRDPLAGRADSPAVCAAHAAGVRRRVDPSRRPGRHVGGRHRPHVERPEPGESERLVVAHAGRAPHAAAAAVPQLEEEHDRAAVPGAGHVRRAEAHARHGGRPHGGQGAAAAGRALDRHRAGWKRPRWAT